MARITKVTTRAGDAGESTTARGKKISKSDPYFAAMGDVDELNAIMGWLRTAGVEPDSLAAAIQQDLFDIGGVIAMEGEMSAPSAEGIEAQAEAMNEQLPPLTEFVIPGGAEVVARCHIARTVCRRAERSAWALGEDYADAAVYLNRLSDLLFVWSRLLNQQAAGEETMWRGPKK